MVLVLGLLPIGVASINDLHAALQQKSVLHTNRTTTSGIGGEPSGPAAAQSHLKWANKQA